MIEAATTSLTRAGLTGFCFPPAGECGGGTPLRSYQAPHASAAYAGLRKYGAVLDGSDTGTGKMWVACWLAQQLGVTPLVIAPWVTLAEWQKVAAKFGVQVETVNYERVRGVRRKVLAKACPFCSVNNQPFLGPFIHRLSASDWGYEKKVGTGSKWVWANEYEMVIFDEVHRCGGMTSLNSKLLIAAKRQACYILCLSATAASDPRQFKALGYTLGLFELSKFKWWLLKHGCEPGVFGGFEFGLDPEDPQKQQKAMAKIHKAIFGTGRAVRMRKRDIPNFPKTFISTKLIPDRDGKAAHLSQELAYLYEGRGRLPLVQAVRGALELLRVPALADMAEDYALTSRVVIFANFRCTIAALRKALKPTFGEVPIIDGDHNDPIYREDVKCRFQADELPILLVNNFAGGEGLGLHGKMDRTALHSPCYSGRQAEQVLGRLPRIDGGYSQQFFVYFSGTLEEQVAAALEQSRNNLTALNDAIFNGVF